GGNEHNAAAQHVPGERGIFQEEAPPQRCCALHTALSVCRADLHVLMLPLHDTSCVCTSAPSHSSSTPATSSASATSTASGLVTPTTGKNQRWAIKVGMSADPMTTVTSTVYWLWVIRWLVRP